jgi:hypothetical protein
LTISAALACGCGSKDEIRSYTVKKNAPPPAADSTSATDRMLGAIVPVGSQTWFFKVTGPTAVINKNADEINKFFASIEVSAGADKPVWKTPESWQEEGPRDMRAATLKIPSSDQSLELSVIPLPSSGAPNELIDNVNRWRSQLKLAPIDEQNLASIVKEAKAGEAKMWLVDLSGQASAGGMMAPFAGGGPFSGGAQPPMNAPFAGGAGRQPAGEGPVALQGGALPPGHPPVAADGGPVDSSIAAPFKFALPKGWHQHPVSGMRKAAFLVTDGDKQAEITAIDLAASAPSIADPLQNVNMWRGNMGLEPVRQDQVANVMQKIEVNGKQANYFELIPDADNLAESKIEKATFAAAVPNGDVIWFFKLAGDRNLVVAQRDNFKSFLKSIQFESEGGSGNGN